MDNSRLIKLALKALLFWLLFSVAGFFWGQKLISSLTPFYEFIVEQVDPNYDATVHVDDNSDVTNIVLTATALKARPITPQQSLPAGRTIESSITVLHALVPIVILLTILSVWPVKNIKQRTVLLTLAIPAIYFISILTAPLQLLGQLEIGFINAAAKYGLVRSNSWILNWMLLTEGGGRWLIPVLTGIACGGIVQRLSKP